MTPASNTPDTVRLPTSTPFGMLVIIGRIAMISAMPKICNTHTEILNLISVIVHSLSTAAYPMIDNFKFIRFQSQQIQRFMAVFLQNHVVASFNSTRIKMRQVFIYLFWRSISSLKYLGTLKPGIKTAEMIPLGILADSRYRCPIPVLTDLIAGASYSYSKPSLYVALQL